MVDQSHSWRGETDTEIYLAVTRHVSTNKSVTFQCEGKQIYIHYSSSHRYSQTRTGMYILSVNHYSLFKNSKYYDYYKKNEITVLNSRLFEQKPGFCTEGISKEYQRQSQTPTNITETWSLKLSKKTLVIRTDTSNLSVSMGKRYIK